MTSERADRIPDWLINGGLPGASEGHLIAGFCQRVLALCVASSSQRPRSSSTPLIGVGFNIVRNRTLS
ncbi:hypothetical protein [Sinorhizobium arboris]|uniref:hypothetical protein n=1 Tax=Sinorhizobium arboris TaxID=76745 RepID=UPI000414C1FD|nr:hypothetical protein [Sinorhizobium arboris]